MYNADMRNLFIKLNAAVLLVALAACASPPQEIPATYVPMKTYADLDCQQIQVELERNAEETGELQYTLQDKANVDAAQMSIGIFFFPTLLFLEGGDGADAKQYARLKGQRRSLAGQVAKKNCAIDLNETDMTLTGEVCRPRSETGKRECLPTIGRRVPLFK